MAVRPGGALATRPLHFIWLADCSGSMKVGGKIQALNNAIREVLPHMKKVAEDNPFAEVLVRAIRFSTGAQWHVAEPTLVDQFRWPDLSAGGYTDMGMALEILAEEFASPRMKKRAFPPVLVLISDGQPTDNFDEGLRSLLASPWGAKAVRIAIAIGQDADDEVLRRFVADSSIEVLRANNAESLIHSIRWASTAALQSVSAPASQLAGGKTSSLPFSIPALPAISNSRETEVW